MSMLISLVFHDNAFNSERKTSRPIIKQNENKKREREKSRKEVGTL